MTKEHITIFSGSSIIVRGLQNRLDDNNIDYVIKNHTEMARLSGFVPSRNDKELLILNIDIEKAQPIVDAYKAEINS
ncbi:DUF2007 domain-containing protein [uncultured Polaribacter sp.]|uniref:putative signal transducing protein n=1 Tax=uncultured Polaribacter sp. TaxID=174711 RepID=UPI0026087125|nr:DUF2007 domain-containing protein [uncultured Polaribacter sp.]